MDIIQPIGIILAVLFIGFIVSKLMKKKESGDGKPFGNSKNKTEDK